jgi:type IV secretion system protein VirB6
MIQIINQPRFNQDQKEKKPHEKINHTHRHTHDHVPGHMLTSGQSSDSINSVMESVYDQGIEASALLSQKAGLNLIVHFYSFLVMILTSAVIFIAAGYIMLGKLAVAVLLALAPFFIMMYLFAGTKSLFEGWLRQVLTFALVPVLTYALLLLISSLLLQTTTQLLADSNDIAAKISMVASFTLVCGVSLFLLAQVMSWSAGIAGGFQLSSLGMFTRGIQGGKWAYRTGARFQRWRKDRQEQKLRRPFG